MGSKHHKGLSIMLLLFYYLVPLLNDCLVTSRCMQFTFGDKREVYLQDESALPVIKKESMQKGKYSIGPRMKYGHSNLNLICAQTNGRVRIQPFISFRLYLSVIQICIFSSVLRFECPYFILGPILFFPTCIFSFSVTGRALSSYR